MEPNIFVGFHEAPHDLQKNGFLFRERLAADVVADVADGLLVENGGIYFEEK